MIIPSVVWFYSTYIYNYDTVMRIMNLEIMCLARYPSFIAISGSRSEYGGWCG